MSTEQLFTQYPDIIEMFSREKQSIDSKNTCMLNEEDTILENTILENTILVSLLVKSVPPILVKSVPL